MLLEPRLIFELALMGVSAGFLAGLLGIGGGMIMVPFMTFILEAKGFLLHDGIYGVLDVFHGWLGSLLLYGVGFRF